VVTILTADGLKFTHPLHHIGRTVDDLPLLVIDSFKHMYLWRHNPKTDLECVNSVYCVLYCTLVCVFFCIILSSAQQGSYCFQKCPFVCLSVNIIVPQLLEILS